MGRRGRLGRGRGGRREVEKNIGWQSHPIKAMNIVILYLEIDSAKIVDLKNDFIIKVLKPESLYIRISNRYYYFFMGYTPFEMKLPEGFYYIEYQNKKDSLFLKGGYIYNIEIPQDLKANKPKKVGYEYQIRKEFNKDISRDSCYLVLEGGTDSLTIEVDTMKYSYKVPSEFYFIAKKKIKIITKDVEKEIFLEPQFIYYINIKSR
ncbi:MAG: hypothetical protein N2504_04495 [candidate division WOR-3 bacterium]|nr:hypothetical protein [candidate division WOR-3 bacterium]